MMDKPKVLAYDLEFRDPLPEGDWSRMTECGVSVLASWSSDEDEPRVWLPEEGEHVWEEFALHALDHEVFLTWNGLSCDDRMIYASFPLWEHVLPRAKRLDLCVVAGLFGIAAKKGLPTDEIEGVLARGVPNNYPQLVGYKRRSTVHVMRGWKLEHAYCETFERESSKSLDGALAPELWAKGHRGRVIGYCVGDARRLLDLWSHAWIGGELRNAKGHVARIPQRVLGARRE